MIIGFMALAFFGKGLAPRLGGDGRYRAERDQRSVRRLVQYVRQYLRHRDANCDWLHRRNDRLIQRRADFTSGCMRWWRYWSYPVLVGDIKRIEQTVAER